jgi:hypothetical protein
MNRSRPLLIVALAGAIAVMVAFVTVSSSPLGPPPGSSSPNVPEAAWSDVSWMRFDVPGRPANPIAPRYVAVTAAGIVAAGLGPNPNGAANPNGLNQTLTVWLTDGSGGWRAVPVAAGVAANEVGEPRAMAASAQGVVIAGGLCCVLERSAMWWSPDGVSWLAAALPDAAGYATSVAGSDAGWVAVGSVAGTGAIWTSADGLTWERVDPDAVALESGDISGVAATDGGFIAVGTDDPGRDSDGAVWRSRGLRDWRRVALADPELGGPEELRLHDVVQIGNRIVAVGGIGTQQDRIDCERMGFDAGAAEAEELAFSCGWLTDDGWVSADGENWQRIGRPPAKHGRDGPIDHGWRMNAWGRLVAAGPTLATFGYETRNGRDGEGLWMSRDALAWRRVGALPHFDPSTATIEAFTVRGNLVAAVGQFHTRGDFTDTRGALWLGEIH